MAWWLESEFVCADTWVWILSPSCIGFNYFIIQLKHVDLIRL